MASQKVGNGKVLVQFRPMNPGSITDPEPISSFLFRSPKESWKPNQGYRKSTAIFQLQFEAVLQNRQKKRRVEQRCPLSRNSFPFSKIKDWLSHNRDSIRKRVPDPNGEGDRFFLTLRAGSVSDGQMMQSGNCQNTIGIIHRIRGLWPPARRNQNQGALAPRSPKPESGGFRPPLAQARIRGLWPPLAETRIRGLPPPARRNQNQGALAPRSTKT